MNDIPATYRYMNELRQIQDLIKNYPASSSGTQCEYEIFYVLPGDADWKQAEWANNDYQRFVKRAEEIIEIFEPDALKVTLKIKNKKQDYVIRLIPGANIPAIDGTTNKAMNRREQRQFELLKNKGLQSNLNGIEEIQNNSGSGLGALQMQNLQKDFDIKLLYRDLEQLKKDNQKLEQENKELTDALFEYEGKADKGKLENLGLLIGAGKLLKMDNQSLLGLAGMLMGGNEADMNLLSESISSEEKSGGLELNGESHAREESIATISQYLHTIDEDSFKKVISLLQLLEKQNGLIDPMLKFAFQSHKEHLPTLKNE